MTSGRNKKNLKDNVEFVQLKKKRSRTCFICKFCNVLLHKGDWFERYHAIKKYYLLEEIIIWIMEYYININVKMILIDKINIV